MLKLINVFYSHWINELDTGGSVSWFSPPTEHDFSLEAFIVKSDLTL